MKAELTIQERLKDLRVERGLMLGGRMLHSMVREGGEGEAVHAQFTYDHTGLRVKKSVNGVDIGIKFIDTVHCNIHPFGFLKEQWLDDFRETGFKIVTETDFSF